MESSSHKRRSSVSADSFSAISGLPSDFTASYSLRQKENDDPKVGSTSAHDASE